MRFEQYYWSIDTMSYSLTKNYYPNGQVEIIERKVWTEYLAEKHGWQKKYNKNGDLLLKERYNRGQLVEKIK